MTVLTCESTYSVNTQCGLMSPFCSEYNDDCKG